MMLYFSHPSKKLHLNCQPNCSTSLDKWLLELEDEWRTRAMPPSFLYLRLVGLRPSPEVDAAVGVGRQRHRVPRRVPVLARLPDLIDGASGGLNIILIQYFFSCVL